MGLLFSGRPFGAEEAASLGLVSRIVPDEHSSGISRISLRSSGLLADMDKMQRAKSGPAAMFEQSVAASEHNKGPKP